MPYDPVDPSSSTFSMPPQRRRVPVAHRPPPYSKGWLSRRRRRDYVPDEDDPSDTNGTCLPNNALSAIFYRCVDAAELVRCASTCQRWGRVRSLVARQGSLGLVPPR